LKDLVEIDYFRGGDGELRGRQAHGLGEADQAGIVIPSFSCPDVKRAAVLFLVIAEVGEVGGDMFKGHGGFQVFRIASGADRYWIVSDVIIINGSGCFRELRVCPLSAVDCHLQNGRAGVGGGGCDEIA